MEDIFVIGSVRKLIAIAEAFDYELRLCFYPSILQPYWRLHAYSPGCDSPFPDSIWSDMLDAAQADILRAMGVR